MRILLLTNEFPLPQDAGGVRRQLGLCQDLAARHELHMLARAREELTPPALVDELRERLDAPVETFPPPPRPTRSPGAKAARWTRSVARRSPPWVLTAYGTELAARAVALAPDFDVAVTLDDNAHMYALDVAPHVPVVLDKHNVHGESWRLRRPWGSGPAGRLVHALTLHQLIAWERRTAAAAAAVVVTSQDEAARFAVLYGRRPHVVPSAIPTPPDVADPIGAPPAIVWLGDHTYPPNRDGLLRFAREGWPQLAEAGATLVVVGRRPPEEVQALERLPGVRIAGFVQDLDPLLASCAAAVAPLWAGAGIKMKTLTLMGAGLPLAGTPVAFEGVAVRTGRDAIVANAPRALAAGLRDLLGDRARAAEMGSRGRRLVLRDHTWSAVGERFEAALEAAVQRRTSRRFVASSSPG